MEQVYTEGTLRDEAAEEVNKKLEEKFVGYDHVTIRREVYDHLTKRLQYLEKLADEKEEELRAFKKFHLEMMQELIVKMMRVDDD